MAGLAEMATPAEIQDAKKREQMRKGYERAPYYSMGTKPPKEAAPAPAPAPARMPPAPMAPAAPMSDAEARARAQVEDEKMMQRMGKAYDEAAPRSMQRFAKGGSVSASRRADGIAKRGKTRGKFV